MHACVSNENVKTLDLSQTPPALMKTSTEDSSNCKSVMMHIIVASLDLVSLTTK